MKTVYALSTAALLYGCSASQSTVQTPKPNPTPTPAGPTLEEKATAIYDIAQKNGGGAKIHDPVLSLVVVIEADDANKDGKGDLVYTFGFTTDTVPETGVPKVLMQMYDFAPLGTLDRAMVCDGKTLQCGEVELTDKLRHQYPKVVNDTYEVLTSAQAPKNKK